MEHAGAGTVCGQCKVRFAFKAMLPHLRLADDFALFAVVVHAARAAAAFTCVSEVQDGGSPKVTQKPHKFRFSFAKNLTTIYIETHLE